jgi:hypothetical protein
VQRFGYFLSRNHFLRGRPFRRGGAHRSGYRARSQASPALQSFSDRRTMFAVTAASAAASACSARAWNSRNSGRGSVNQRYSVARPMPTALAAW